MPRHVPSWPHIYGEAVQRLHYALRDFVSICERERKKHTKWHFMLPEGKVVEVKIKKAKPSKPKFSMIIIDELEGEGERKP